MKKFQPVTSHICPLPIRDVDTDLIIPAQFMTSVSREGYGEHLFQRLRDKDPNFCLNQDRFRSAQILVANENFACGSSREHAVWALTAWGFKVVIAKSFADIFSSNSAKNGLLLVTLEPTVIDELIAKAEKDGVTMTVDLESQSVKLQSGESYKFDYDPFRKHCLLEGLEDVDYIFSKKEQIESFRTRQKSKRFFSTADLSVS